MNRSKIRRKEFSLSDAQRLVLNGEEGMFTFVDVIFRKSSFISKLLKKDQPSNLALLILFNLEKKGFERIELDFNSLKKHELKLLAMIDFENKSASSLSTLFSFNLKQVLREKYLSTAIYSCKETSSKHVLKF